MVLYMQHAVRTLTPNLNSVTLLYVIQSQATMGQTDRQADRQTEKGGLHNPHVIALQVTKSAVS